MEKSLRGKTIIFKKNYPGKKGKLVASQRSVWDLGREALEQSRFWLKMRKNQEF